MHPDSMAYSRCNIHFLSTSTDKMKHFKILFSALHILNVEMEDQSISFTKVKSEY